MNNNKSEINPAQAGTSGKPNVQTHPHSGRGETPENDAIAPAPVVSGAVPCSPSSEMAYAYLYDKDTKDIRGSIDLEAHYLNGRIGIYSHIPNLLIKKFGGIKENERVRVTRLTQQELRSEWLSQSQAQIKPLSFTIKN